MKRLIAFFIALVLLIPPAFAGGISTDTVVAKQSYTTGAPFTSAKITLTGVDAYPQRDDYLNAADGSLGTSSYVTPSGNTTSPSYLMIKFSRSTSLGMMRCYAGIPQGGVIMNLTLQYTNDAVPSVNSGNWTTVTGLLDGNTAGGELLGAGGTVNSNGVISNYTQSAIGWTSFHFDRVTATAFRVSFTCTQYAGYNAWYVVEMEAYATSGGAGAVTIQGNTYNTRIIPDPGYTSNSVQTWPQTPAVAGVMAMSSSGSISVVPVMSSANHASCTTAHGTQGYVNSVVGVDGTCNCVGY